MLLLGWDFPSSGDYATPEQALNLSVAQTWNIKARTFYVHSGNWET